jgi:toxin CcdB
MAQFDVCLNPNADSAPAIPYLLEVQSDLLESVSTRVVVPLALLSERGQPARHLNPQFEIEGVQVVMVTEQIAGIPKRAIGKRVLSLAIERDQIMDAIDFLFRGF